MADNTVQIKIEVVGADGAQTALNKVKNTTKTSGSSMAGSMFVALAAFEAFKRGVDLAADGVKLFVEASAEIVRSSIETAANIQEQRLSFDNMLGSAEAGKKLFTEISEFAFKTPFESTDLRNSAKQLLAYNVAADDIVPTLRNLGTVASIVGREKMPEIILAYGQVKAATILTGAELRQFTETGLPMLQLLADKYNSVGGAAKQMNEKQKASFDKLNDTYAKRLNKEQEMKEKGNTSGAAWKNLQIDLANSREEISKLTGGMKNHIVTAGDVKKMIEDQQVSFEDVNAVIGDYAGSHGDLLDKQSRTFNGMMSNIEEFKTTILAAMGGIDAVTGDLIEGGLLDILSEQLEGIVQFLFAHREEISSFFSNLGRTLGDLATNVLFNLLIPAWDYLRKAFEIALPYLKETWTSMVDIYNTLKDAGAIEALKALVKTFGALMFLGLIGFILGLNSQLKALKDFLKSPLGQTMLHYLLDPIVRLNDAFNKAIASYDRLMAKMRAGAGQIAQGSGGSRFGGGANGGVIQGKYASGGIIPGMNTSGDRVVIGANSGEMVLNKRTQSGLFNFLKSLENKPNINFNAPISFGGQRGEMQQMNVFQNLLQQAV